MGRYYMTSHKVTKGVTMVMSQSQYVTGESVDK